MTLEQLITQAKLHIARGELEQAEELTERAKAISAERGIHPDPAIRKHVYNAHMAVAAGNFETADAIIDRAKGIIAGETKVNLSVLRTVASWYTNKPVGVEIKSIEGGLSELDGDTIVLDESLFTDRRKHQLTPEFMAQVGQIVRGNRISNKCADIADWRSKANHNTVAARALAIALKNRDDCYAWAQGQTMTLAYRLRHTYNTDSLYNAATEN